MIQEWHQIAQGSMYRISVICQSIGWTKNDIKKQNEILTNLKLSKFKTIFSVTHLSVRLL